MAIYLFMLYMLINSPGYHILALGVFNNWMDILRPAVGARKMLLLLKYSKYNFFSKALHRY